MIVIVACLSTLNRGIFKLLCIGTCGIIASGFKFSNQSGLNVHVHVYRDPMPLIGHPLFQKQFLSMSFPSLQLLLYRS